MTLHFEGTQYEKKDKVSLKKVKLRNLQKKSISLDYKLTIFKFKDRMI